MPVLPTKLRSRDRVVGFRVTAATPGAGAAGASDSSGTKDRVEGAQKRVANIDRTTPTPSRALVRCRPGGAASSVLHPVRYPVHEPERGAVFQTLAQER